MVPGQRDSQASPAGAPDPSGVRAADADRERTVEELRQHAAEGRLQLEELEERTQAALAARTLGDLAQLVRDLPQRRRPSRGPRRRGNGMRPELRPFLAVTALLVTIWALTGMGYFWPIWPILGWGVPLLAFGRAPFAHCGHRGRRAHPA